MTSAATSKVDLGGLQTETRNPRSTAIDRVPTQEICRILNRDDARIAAAVEACIPAIAEAIDALSERVRNGGRVFYIGAGTSGRLGVLDASEIPPTYSAPTDQFVALIAGGDHALRNAKEGAEDSRSGAEADLAPFGLNPEVDSLIGIASSGRTPYVLGGLAYAKALGCATVGVVCVSPSAVEHEGNADHVIAAVTGPEVVTGSTRMKAGTATKLVLNMMSTGIMIRLGKTYGNLMIDLKATNLKLIQRARNMLRIIGGPTCTHSDEELDDTLKASRGSVKIAAVAVTLKVSVPEAEQRLERNKGVLARVFEEEREKQLKSESLDEGLVLCVDAGGTSCKAVVMAKDGTLGRGAAGPCNVSSIGLDAAISSISQAIQQAIDANETTRGRQFKSVKFSSAWIGMAGYDRPSLAPLIDAGLADLLNMQVGEGLKVTTDIDLLPAALATNPELDSVVVLVAGTGSVAMSYTRKDGRFQRTGRVGGWGHLLGDDGSGYGIGREALRKALRCSELYRMRKNAATTAQSLRPLSQAVVEHFKSQYPESKPEDLLSSVIAPDSALHQTGDSSLSTTKRIAGVAKVVFAMLSTDEDARQIIENGATSLAELVTILVETQEGVSPAKTGLLLAGGLMQDELYKKSVVDIAEKSVGKFQHVEVVSEPAIDGARFLLGCQRI